MEFANYQLDWPRENLSVRCFVHDVFNYRYHWHEDEYELNILLHGRQECCRGSENFHLDVDDVILVPPGVGHAFHGFTGGYHCLCAAFFRLGFQAAAQKRRHL